MNIAAGKTKKSFNDKRVPIHIGVSRTHGTSEYLSLCADAPLRPLTVEAHRDPVTITCTRCQALVGKVLP